MVNFDKFLSENTVIFVDFSLKIIVVHQKYVSWGSIQEGVLLTRIRYVGAYDFICPTFSVGAEWVPFNTSQKIRGCLGTHGTHTDYAPAAAVVKFHSGRTVLRFFELQLDFW